MEYGPYLPNFLYKKVAVFDGDSICAGIIKDGILPWANIIGDRNSMEYYNYAVGGGTVTAEVYNDAGKPRHWISRTIDLIHSEHENLDYLILEGGTNDADLLINSPERFGELSAGDYSGEYDDTTFTGALELLFYKAINYYPTAKLGYVIAHKMGKPEEGYGADYKRRKFFLRIIEVCKKWGVPYIDLWECAPLCSKLKCHHDPELTKAENNERGKMYIDSQHLGNAGYRLVSDKIEAFMRQL